MSCPRQAAYLAYLQTLRGQSFLHESLNQWIQKDTPNTRDINLAYITAYGTMRHEAHLDYFLESFAQIPKKRKEKALIRQMVYQWNFLDKIPLYALKNSYVEVAKTCVSKPFANFVNALTFPHHLPTLHQTPLPLRYSQPPFLIESLMSQYPLAKVEQILTQFLITPEKQDLEYRPGKTPQALVNHLSHIPSPRNILDLCASPGGKLLLASQRFPHANLFANDISQKKIDTLLQHIQAHTTIYPAEQYPLTQTFDLVICDVPCSNSGVLHKKPEARLRLEPSQIQQHTALQKQILQRAAKLAPNIWYMTCSLLQEENEHIVHYATDTLGLECKTSLTILPDTLQQLDGGFGALLTRSPAQ